MSRRIFREKGFNLDRRVLSYDQFKLFCDKEDGFKINEEHFPNIIKKAEELLDRPIPQLLASDYMMFKRDGNRSIFEGQYFPRRSMAMKLALGEYVERKGRFTDKLINVLWLILEESTWVLPAHNPGKPGINSCLTYSYKDEVDYIDLFAATTAADISFIYYLVHDILDEVTPLICDRLLYELNRRIIKPYLNPNHMWDINWWSGVRGNTVNNWCPWITSNILTVAALTVKDTTTRTQVIRLALDSLDAFTMVYHPDGGCDEGPSYWNAAGGALFNACEVAYDMTGGYVNVYDDPLIKNMGEYAVKVMVTESRVLNFADSPSRVRASAMLLYHWGVACNSEFMKSYGMWRQNGELCGVEPDTSMPYRWFKYLTEPRFPKSELVLPKNFFIDGIVVAGSRENNELAKGLYVALKGGHNAESHNHNDVGNIVVFSDDKPIFIDAGSGSYTRRTFSGERYTIWAMCSDYHNCVTFNGVTQLAGGKYRSTDSEYNEETGKLKLNLINAYPETSKLTKYTRSAELANSVITVEDDVEMSEASEVMFTFLTIVKPDNVRDGAFDIQGRTVEFDPTLTYAIDECDKTWPEVAGIPRGWDAEVLYRIRLTSKEPIKAKKYILTVK